MTKIDANTLVTLRQLQKEYDPGKKKRKRPARNQAEFDRAAYFALNTVLNYIDETEHREHVFNTFAKALKLILSYEEFDPNEYLDDDPL